MYGNGSCYDYMVTIVLAHVPVFDALTIVLHSLVTTALFETSSN